MIGQGGNVRHNRAQFVTALQSMFGIKGQLQTTLDTSLLANINVADLWDSPYLRYGIPVSEERDAAAQAALNGYVSAQPGATVALQLTNIIINNTSAAAVRYFVRLLTATQFGTLTAGGGRTAMADLSSNAAGSVRSSSVVDSVFNGAAVGNGVISIQLAANTSTNLQLPRPGIILYGNDENGIPACSVVSQTQNSALAVSFIGREWPLT